MSTDFNPATSPQLEIAQAQVFGRSMAEELFTLNHGPATPHRATALVLRLDDLAAICACAFAMGRGRAQPERIPTGEATELPVETIYPGTLQ